jgi:hypothetical protein
MQTKLPPAKVTPPAFALPDDLAAVGPHRLRWALKKVARALRKLDAAMDDGSDPVATLIQLTKHLRFPERPNGN